MNSQLRKKLSLIFIVFQFACKNGLMQVQHCSPQIQHELSSRCSRPFTPTGTRNVPTPNCSFLLFERVTAGGVSYGKVTPRKNFCMRTLPAMLLKLMVVFQPLFTNLT